MISVSVTKKRSLPVQPDSAPFAWRIRADIQLHVPEQADPNLVASVLTSALAEVATQYGEALREKGISTDPQLPLWSDDDAA